MYYYYYYYYYYYHFNTFGIQFKSAALKRIPEFNRLNQSAILPPGVNVTSHCKSCDENGHCDKVTSQVGAVGVSTQLYTMDR